MKITEARTYLVLAMTTRNLEQRREYAFLSVTAANIAAMSAPNEGGARIALARVLNVANQKGLALQFVERNKLVTHHFPFG